MSFGDLWPMTFGNDNEHKARHAYKKEEPKPNPKLKPSVIDTSCNGRMWLELVITIHTLVSCHHHRCQSVQKAASSPSSQYRQCYCHSPPACQPHRHGLTDRSRQSVTRPSVVAEPHGSSAAASSCWGTAGDDGSESRSWPSLQQIVMSSHNFTMPVNRHVSTHTNILYYNSSDKDTETRHSFKSLFSRTLSVIGVGSPGRSCSVSGPWRWSKASPVDRSIGRSRRRQT